MKMIAQTACKNLEDSLSFYSKLGFTEISLGHQKGMSDGKNHILINPVRTARPGLCFYQVDWSEELNLLKDFSHIVEEEDGYLLSSPSGVWIYLKKEAGPEIPETSEASFSILGNYAGFSFESIDMQKSVGFWKIFDFEITMGGADQGWVALKNTYGHELSLMKPNACPHLFFNPSFTYFNGGKNLPVIEKIRATETPIAEEITTFNKEGIVDNVILVDPGGFGFFIFND